MKRKQQMLSACRSGKVFFWIVAIWAGIAVISSGCRRTMPPSSTPAAADNMGNTEYESVMADKDEIDQTVHKKEQGEDSDGWYYIEEKTWIPVVDTLGRSLQKARHDIAENRLDAAAANVRRGTAFLMNEMSKLDGSSDAAQKQLEDTVALLNQIALDLEAGRLDKTKIDKAFAAAHRIDIQNRWIVATTEEWVPFLDQPDVHLNRARDLFRQKNFDAAALELRKTIAYMELENNRVPGEAKEALNEPIKELEELSKEVEKGAVDDVAKLDDVFTRIDYALAKHHYRASVFHWEDLDLAATGYSMKAAAQYLEHAIERTKMIATDTTNAFVQKTMSIADGLIKGAGTASKDAGKQLEKMGQVIIDMEGKIKPAA
jgi:hypothetical protein